MYKTALEQKVDRLEDDVLKLKFHIAESTRRKCKVQKGPWASCPIQDRFGSFNLDDLKIVYKDKKKEVEKK